MPPVVQAYPAPAPAWPAMMVPAAAPPPRPAPPPVWNPPEFAPADYSLFEALDQAMASQQAAPGGAADRNGQPSLTERLRAVAQAGPATSRPF
ncbi:hypothetical protein [Roseomonas sp. BN140053]|uniref:hypothetical protein n=1 Tax=Roseomonas sp. BN140053 TaxID=3391898 RepID=UPI0039E976FB